MNIHIGAGPKVLKDFINCDCRPLPGIDKVFNIEKDFPYPFADGTVSFILTEETLEHLSWRVIGRVFAEFYRILKKGGRASIQVPDIGKMCENYVNKEVCACVPHKAATLEDFKAEPNCEICHGKGKVNPTRWLMAFCGAQKHPWDVHKMVFTKEIMAEMLEEAGFKIIGFEDHIYKIKVLAEKC